MVRERIALACREAGRDPAGVTLVGVTKGHPREAVLAAIAAGLTEAGENYAREAAEKYAGLPGLRKHFVGHVQTNKARLIVETFDMVQSIDRLDAGRALAKASRALGRTVKALVQVNVSPVERFGVAPRDAAELAARLREEEGLEIEGVMAIGPLGCDSETTRRAFATAREAFERVGGSTLSLGMSADLEEAIVCGSTMVRIGTAIFGKRI